MIAYTDQYALRFHNKECINNTWTPILTHCTSSWSVNTSFQLPHAYIYIFIMRAKPSAPSFLKNRKPPL